MSPTICLLGALDTKGAEYSFLATCLKTLGAKIFIIDVGVLGSPSLEPDITREEVARAGGADLKALISEKDRGAATAAMSCGITKVLVNAQKEGKFDAVIALGGTGGTAVACAGMRALPLGVPKVMVSTVAGSDVSGYVGVSDITMIPSIVDVAGVNSISREVFAKAAGAVFGMASAKVPAGDDKPLITASMFGNTTPAVDHARGIFEKAGYEVLVFHCTGNGGKTMESLITEGRIAGNFDLTTTEWADELVGGVFAAGPDRLTASARAGIPTIVTPSCLDMVNFWAPDTVPDKFAGRTFYPHNPNVTLMRTNKEECAELGKIFAERLNESKGPVTFLYPKKGWSMIDAPGGKFWFPEANEAFLKAFKANKNDHVKLIEVDANVNDEEFSGSCAEELLNLLK